MDLAIAQVFKCEISVKIYCFTTFEIHLHRNKDTHNNGRNVIILKQKSNRNYDNWIAQCSRWYLYTVGCAAFNLVNKWIRFVWWEFGFCRRFQRQQIVDKQKRAARQWCSWQKCANNWTTCAMCIYRGRMYVWLALGIYGYMEWS